jgi:hypothetical protein
VREVSTDRAPTSARRALLALGALLLVTTTLRSPAARAKAPEGQFHDNGDGTVTDTVTGLLWQRVAAPYAAFGNWETASSYCAAPPDLPGTGWRIPSVKELATLVDRNGGDGHFIDRDAFPGDEDSSGHFWTSTLCQEGQGCTTGYFVVDFRYGQIVPPAGWAHVLCVRSP